MKKILHKLTTKPAWWIEKHRPYPIRDNWKLLPPLPAPDGPVVFAILTPPHTFNDALWTAWSWLRFLGDRVRLEIYVDGPPTDDMRRAQDQLLPGSGLFNAIDAIRAEGEYPPHVESFITDNKTGRKAGLLLALQRRGRFLFSDADILAFAEPTELLDLLATPDAGAYFCEGAGSNFANGTVARAAQLGIAPLESLNSGLVLVPHNSLSWDLANDLLEGWQTPPINWVIEQTLVACLLASARVTPLPRERYVLTNARQFYWEPDVDYSRIVARHFTGTTRHVMYSRAMPWILRRPSRM